MTGTGCYFNENLRSISAVVEAKNQQSSGTKLPSQPVTIIKIHHIPSTVNQTHPNTRSKLPFIKSSKVAPCNGNVFYFDDRSDLTVTDVFGKRHGKKSNTSTWNKKFKCTCLFICLFILLLVVLVVSIVLIALFVPAETTSK